MKLINRSSKKFTAGVKGMRRGSGIACREIWPVRVPRQNDDLHGYG